MHWWYWLIGAAFDRCSSHHSLAGGSGPRMSGHISSDTIWAVFNTVGLRIELNRCALHWSPFLHVRRTPERLAFSLGAPFFGRGKNLVVAGFGNLKRTGVAACVCSLAPHMLSCHACTCHVMLPRACARQTHDHERADPVTAAWQAMQQCAYTHHQHPSRHRIYLPVWVP